MNGRDMYLQYSFLFVHSEKKKTPAHHSVSFRIRIIIIIHVYRTDWCSLEMGGM